MSFVMLAIARGASASRAASVLPVDGALHDVGARLNGRSRRIGGPEPECERRDESNGEEAPAHHARLSVVITAPLARAARRGARPGRCRG